MMFRFERLLRDQAMEQGKVINFHTHGSDTQLDKTIVEQLMDPVMHIIRNSISHGIESAEERKAAGKSPEGNISLEAFYSGANVQIDINDDGRGFDTEKIRAQAIENGLISNEQEISHDDLLQYTFQAGFTTSKDVNDLSGRGVGMDVIRKNLEKIRGEVFVKSKKGQGSTISLLIPLTLSIVEGLLVAVDDVRIIIPVALINWVDSVEGKQLNGHNRIISLKGESIPVIPLFFEPEDAGTQKVFPVLVVNDGDEKYGIAVKQVHGQYQTVLKPLGNYLNRRDEFSGGSVLGDGSVAFVLDVRKFLAKRKEHYKVKQQNSM
jgi:two-component system chemotaxis sensor kinase CheA